MTQCAKASAVSQPSGTLGAKSSRGITEIDLRELKHKTGKFSPLANLLDRTPDRVTEGVLDFVAATGDDYCENFGTQWNRFREIQLDSRSSKSTSRDRFFAETGWT